jgi:hypothetical protein
VFWFYTMSPRLASFISILSQASLFVLSKAAPEIFDLLFCSVLSTFFLSRRRQKEKEARIPTYTTQPGFGRCPSHERKLNDTTNKCALSFDAIDVTLTGGVLLGWMPVAGTWLCCLVHVPGSPLLHDHVAALYTTEIAHIPNEVRQPLHYR